MSSPETRPDPIGLSEALDIWHAACHAEVSTIDAMRAVVAAVEAAVRADERRQAGEATTEVEYRIISAMGNEWLCVDREEAERRAAGRLGGHVETRTLTKLTTEWARVAEGRETGETP